MRGIINNIINLYEIQAKALSVLVANTQKALNEFEKNKKADEQAKRVESFVKDLIMDLNNMMTKFYWLKDRKQRQHEEVTTEQVNAMVDFAHWVKSLTQKVQPILEYFQKSPTFAEKVDRDMKELEAHIKAQLKRFNEVLEETPDALSIRLGKYANTLSEAIREFFTQRRLSILKPKQPMHMKQPEEQPYNNKEKISAFVASPPDEELENLIDGLDISSTQKSNNKSKRYAYSKI